MGLNQRNQPFGSKVSKFIFGWKFVETHLLKDLSQEKVQYSDSKTGAYTKIQDVLQIGAKYVYDVCVQ